MLIDIRKIKVFLVKPSIGDQVLMKNILSGQFSDLQICVTSVFYTLSGGPLLVVLFHYKIDIDIQKAIKI